MQTLLYLFDAFGFFSWLFLLGCVFAGVAFAHTSWAYKQTQILHLRREQSRLRQELALRERSLARKSPSGVLVPGIPREPTPPVSPERQQALPERLPRRSMEAVEPRVSRRASSPATFVNSSRAARHPRRASLREDRQLGLVFFLAPEETDPLDRLPSITTAQVRDLNMLGVYKFEQIARWSETNLQAFAVLLGIDPLELARLGWVHRARILHGETHGSKMILAS